MQEFEFVAAGSVEEACRLLAESGARAIAGGTDVIPRLQRSIFPASVLVDISRLDELRFIREAGDWIEIGALTNYTEMLESVLLQALAPSLIEAAWTVGSPQTRYRGTIGGNIANASPAGDTLPPLLAHEAEVRLVRNDGERSLPLTDFFLGPGKTALEQGELLHTVRLRRLPPGSGTAFIKLGNRRGMNIAVASVGVMLTVDPEQRIQKARIAFGSVAPTPRRSYQAEALLQGQQLTDDLLAQVAAAAQQDISPIGDVRATDGYRRHSVGQILQRALKAAVAAATEGRVTA
jgi:carbon-monoxide dehydrogenase medium subunit